MFFRSMLVVMVILTVALVAVVGKIVAEKGWLGFAGIPGGATGSAPAVVQRPALGSAEKRRAGQVAEKLRAARLAAERKKKETSGGIQAEREIASFQSGLNQQLVFRDGEAFYPGESARGGRCVAVQAYSPTRARAVVQTADGRVMFFSGRLVEREKDAVEETVEGVGGSMGKGAKKVVNFTK